jgi:hypothetical protein
MDGFMTVLRAREIRYVAIRGVLVYRVRIRRGAIRRVFGIGVLVEDFVVGLCLGLNEDDRVRGCGSPRIRFGSRADDLVGWPDRS